MPNFFVFSGSCVWSTATAMARGLATRGVLKSVKLDSRVISVGNLQAGGGGKTPLVALIANEAADRGLRVGILLRGYKSQWEKTGGLIFPGDSMVEPTLCGDEPALLHELCPRAYIGVGADRVKQYHLLTEAIDQRRDEPLDLVILDDGFQHWRIQKDLDIVALTSTSRWKTLFRDWPRAVRGADLVVWTKGDQLPLSKSVLGPLPVVRVKSVLPTALIDQPIWLVTGVADGSSARETVSLSGYRVARHLSFPDHFRYDSSTVLEIMKKAALGRCRVALTGKDWVKWKNLGISQSEVLVLEPRLVFLEGRDAWLQKLWGKSF